MNGIVRYGKWTVIEKTERKGYWVCRCDCGYTGEQYLPNLKAGHSLGCRRCYHDSRRLPGGEALSTYRYSAKTRGLAFELEREDLARLISEPCHWCSRDGGGIDRLDNNRGYVLENCVPCCRRCNVAKNTMSAAEWLELVAAVARTHGLT